MTARRIMWSFSRVHGGRSRLLFKFNSPFLKISPNFILSTCRSSSFSSFPWSNRRSCPTVWFRSQLSYSTLESLATFSGYHDGPRDDEMNEFLSRFVWIMRRKLVEFYKDLDKQTMNSMLLLIVKKVVSEMDKGGGAEEAENTSDFSEDLWKTVKEVSSMVLEDMQKVERKEKMKIFLHCDEVKVMHKFAWDSGVRGDLLRELRFKWAREKLEKHEAYLRFEKMKQEEEEESNKCEVEEDAIVMEESSGVCFPLRKGELRYKIYGLDLSDRTWEDVADRIHVASDTIWPPEAKEITGKCKLATEKVISMNGDDDDGEEILAEWASLVQPKRVDWMCLLDRVKERNIDLYFKVAEMVLKQSTYETTIRDYSRLIDHHAKAGRTSDVERLLLHMTESGLTPDSIIFSVLIRMYTDSGDSFRASQAFHLLRKDGSRPDDDLYRIMVTAHVNSGDPRAALALVREMEAGGVKVTEPVYLSVLRGFCRKGDANEAHRIATTMQFEGIPPSRESCGLMVEAYGRAGDSAQARANLDHMRRLGFDPDDMCLSTVVAAYEKGNYLDKALHLLMDLEKCGVEPGPFTYSVLIGWLARLTLVEEAEQLLYRISELGEEAPVQVYVGLCSMYARVGMEEKARSAFRVLESRKKTLGRPDFENVISGFRVGGFREHMENAVRLMETCGFNAPLDVKMSMAVLERARTFQKPI